MLKYISKFAMDVLPSVIATIIGAYIVNHYIVTKPVDRRTGAAVATVGPKPRPIRQPQEPTARIRDIFRCRQHPRARGDAPRGYPKGHAGTGHRREIGVVEKPQKSLPKSRRRPRAFQRKRAGISPATRKNGRQGRASRPAATVAAPRSQCHPLRPSRPRSLPKSVATPTTSRARRSSACAASGAGSPPAGSCPRSGRPGGAAGAHRCAAVRPLPPPDHGRNTRGRGAGSAASCADRSRPHAACGSTIRIDRPRQPTFRSADGRSICMPSRRSPRCREHSDGCRGHAFGGEVGVSRWSQPAKTRGIDPNLVFRTR